MELDHIGYLVENIGEAIGAFSALGYDGGPVVPDDIQKCRICLLKAPGEAKVELVEPYPENRPMLRLLSKRGQGPYHPCFAVDDIDAVYEEFAAKEGWTPLFAPVRAAAFRGRRITYFLNATLGYVEFLEAQ